MEAGGTLTPARVRKDFGSSVRGFSLGDRFSEHARPPVNKRLYVDANLYAILREDYARWKREER